MSFPPPNKAGTKRNTNAQSSHASSSQQHHNRVAHDMDSLQMSVSELSIDNKLKSSQSSQAAPQADDGGAPTRERGDSEDSRVSGTSAFMRFLHESRDIFVLHCRELVSGRPDDFLIEVSLTLKGDAPAKSTWVVLRSRDDITAFYERVMMTGPGNKFPIPPWGAPSEKSGGVLASSSSSGGGGSSLLAKHSKKKIRAPARSASFRGVFSAVASVFHSGNSSSSRRRQKSANMQEFLDDALEFWQRKWRSKSEDEQGLSLAFENFLCNSAVYGASYSQESSAPESLRAAFDALTLGGQMDSRLGDGGPSRNSSRTLTLIAMDPKRSAQALSSAKAYLTMVEHFRMHGAIDDLRYNVYMYSWARYVSKYSPVDSATAASLSASSSSSSLATLSFAAGGAPAAAAAFALHRAGGDQNTEDASIEFYFSYKNSTEKSAWKPDPTRAVQGTFVDSLVNVFSTPPTPHSAEHYSEVWTSFTDTILFRAECLLQYRIYCAESGTAGGDQRQVRSSPVLPSSSRKGLSGVGGSASSLVSLKTGT